MKCNTIQQYKGMNHQPLPKKKKKKKDDSNPYIAKRKNLI